jgi:hypothetical protein
MPFLFIGITHSIVKKRPSHHTGYCADYEKIHAREKIRRTLRLVLNLDPIGTAIEECP